MNESFPTDNYNKTIYDLQDVNLECCAGDLDNLSVISQSAYFGGWKGSVPNLFSIGGHLVIRKFKMDNLSLFNDMKILYWEGVAPKLKFIGKEAVFNLCDNDFPALEIIGEKAFFNGWKGSAPNLRQVNGRKFRWKEGL